MKRFILLKIIICLASSVFALEAFAQPTYSYYQITDELVEPDLIVNARGDLLFSEGPDSDILYWYRLDTGLIDYFRNVDGRSAILNDVGHFAFLNASGNLEFYVVGEYIIEFPSVVSFDINNNRQCVYEHLGNIYLFDESNPIQMTFDGVSHSPKISDNGDIYWLSYVESQSGVTNLEVFYYDGIKTQQITSNDYNDELLEVSAKGQAVWSGEENYDLYFYDRNRVNQLTDSPQIDLFHSINAKGQVAWVGGLGADSAEIYLFQKGKGTRQITTNTYEDYKPYINDKGNLTWMAKAGPNSTWETFFFDGITTQRLTDNDTFDMNPIMNNRGTIVWTHHTGPYIQSGELHAFDGKDFWNITEDNPEDIFDVPNLITSTGNIVYSKYRAFGSPGSQEFYVTIYYAVKN